MKFHCLLLFLISTSPAYADTEQGSTSEAHEMSPEERRQERLERIRARRLERESERASSQERRGQSDTNVEMESIPSTRQLLREMFEGRILVVESVPLSAGPRPWSPVVIEERVPRSVLPHCLAGLDPFSSAMGIWHEGERTGLEIVSSVELTVAHFLGFMPGDRITHINTDPVDSLSALRRVKRRSRRGQDCVYSVQRGVFPVELTVSRYGTSENSLVLDVLRPGEPSFPADLPDTITESRQISRVVLLAFLSESSPGSWAIPSASNGDAFEAVSGPWGDMGFAMGDTVVKINGHDTGVTTGGMERLLATLLVEDQLTLEVQGAAGDIRTLHFHAEGSPMPQAEIFVSENPIIQTFGQGLNTRTVLERVREENDADVAPRLEFRAMPRVQLELRHEFLNEATWRLARDPEATVLGLVVWDPGPTMKELGVADGDVLLAINGQTPASVEDLADALEKDLEPLTLQLQSSQDDLSARVLFRNLSGEQIRVLEQERPRAVHVTFDSGVEPVAFASLEEIPGPDLLLGLFDDVRLYPYMDSDLHVLGYRLSGMRRGSVLRRMGLMNGDILHGTKHIGMTSMDDVMRMTDLLTGSGVGFRVELQLTRRNQRITVIVERSPDGGWDEVGTAYLAE